MNTRFPSRSFKARAFTLVELLTVIAIIGILAGILIPTVARVRAQARNTQCVSNLRQWGQAARLFSADYKGLIALYVSAAGVQTPTDGTPSFDPKIYARYFSQPNMLLPDGRSVSSQLVMSRCPSESDLSLYRNYGFGRPTGSRSVAATAFGLQGSAISAYNVNEAANPSRLLLMIELAPASYGQVTVDNGGQLATKVVPMATVDGQIRHNGNANAVFLDGHVVSYSSSQLDYSNAVNKAQIDRWFTLQ